MTPSEVTVLLATLSEVYPRRIGCGDAAQTAKVWSLLLADASADDVMAAAVAWMRSAKPHPPVPGDLLATADKAQALTAEEAWGLVRKEISNTGYTGTPDLPTLAMQAIQAVGGEWGAMCRTLQSNEVTALRARFLEAYRNMGEREHVQTALGAARQLQQLAAPLANQYRLQDAEGSTGGR